MFTTNDDEVACSRNREKLTRELRRKMLFYHCPQRAEILSDLWDVSSLLVDYPELWKSDVVSTAFKLSGGTYSTHEQTYLVHVSLCIPKACIVVVCLFQTGGGGERRSKRVLQPK